MAIKLIDLLKELKKHLLFSPTAPGSGILTELNQAILANSPEILEGLNTQPQELDGYGLEPKTHFVSVTDEITFVELDWEKKFLEDGVEYIGNPIWVRGTPFLFYAVTKAGERRMRLVDAARRKLARKSD